MPSIEVYMAMKVDDLRRELSSRGLPTEGLKKDLAFRLASSDNPYAFRPLRLPHTISALPSVTSNKEVMLRKLEDSNTPTTEVRNRGPRRSSPSRNEPSLPSVHDYRGNEYRRIRTAFRISLLSIFPLIFLSCLLWYYLPNVDKEYLTMRLDNGHDFVSSKINKYQNLVNAKIKNGHDTIFGIPEACFHAEDLTWLHYPNHYKVLDIPKDASDSTIKGAYNLKVSRWQDENAVKLSVGEEIPGKAVKILRQSRDVLLRIEERERFDSGERPLKCCEECI